MAQDFDATFSAMDVSFAADVQLAADATDGDIEVYLTFGHVVNSAEAIALFGATADADGDKGGVVNVYNKFGNLIDATTHTVAVAQRDLDPSEAADDVRYDGKSYMLTIGGLAPVTSGAVDNLNPVKVEIFLAEGKIDNANPAESKKNKKGSLTVNLVGADPNPSIPMPVRIALSNNLLVPAAGFTGANFNIIVTLSEEPKEGKFTKDHLDVAKGTAGDGVFLGTKDPDANNDDTLDDGVDGYTSTVAETGRGRMHYQYLVPITPKNEDGDLVIKLKSFEDQNMPTPNKYSPPTNDLARTEGTDKLTVKIKKATVGAAKTAGLKIGLAKDVIIPGGGYLVVTEDTGASAVHDPHSDDSKRSDPPKAHIRTPAEMMYNVLDSDIPNLESFLSNGGAIGIMGPHALMITEIMWGSDASLKDPGGSQWIELHNAGAQYKTQDGDNTTYLVFYGAGEAPSTRLHDLAGTVDNTAGYWSLAGKGQSGRSGKDEQPTEFGPIGATSPIISMTRVPSATGGYGKGTLADSWVQSSPPSSNFEAAAPGVHIGSPGTMPVTFPEPPKKEVKEEAPVIEAAMSDEIDITEIMVDTDDGRLPQWIELTYSGMDKATLDGWNMVIDNAIDAGVLGGGNAITISLSGLMVDVSKNPGNMGKGQSVLVVAWSTSRHSTNIQSARVLDAGAQLGRTGRTQLLSANGFRITLVPPGQAQIAAPGDIAGNLHEDWEIMMSDGAARSSLIRYDMLADGTATMGTDANAWVLASDTPLNIGPESFYGDDEDSSTPGQHDGGPLPVELSHFRPARDKATGAVVITWATQSELNNAGFFIKRSQQRDGEFKVINTAMVPGAGTTSEKQFYTYTDTTAQPNVVYYYQIEDVSLDGNRQLLTRGTRLKGHIGAAGKATVIWGELKESQ